MQRHIPLGYRIQNGRVEIQRESAKLVKEIFMEYLSGISTNQIAKELMEKGILNASSKPLWNHGTVGKVLENWRYLGDEFYPPLIEKEVFEKVQQRRKEQASALGRVRQPDSYVNQSIWSRLLACGECGQPYRKYREKKKQPKWRCKHYLYKNRVLCRNDVLSEPQLEQAYIKAINQVIEKPVYLEQGFLKSPMLESTAERKLTMQIGNLMASPLCDAGRVKQLAFQRASEQYRNTSVDDRDYQNEKIKKVLNAAGRQTMFNPELLEQTIDRIVVQKHTGLQFYLKNGRSITIPGKEET